MSCATYTLQLSLWGRSKQILADTLHTRTLAHQQIETLVGCAILNRLLHLAKPESSPITKEV